MHWLNVSRIKLVNSHSFILAPRSYKDHGWGSLVQMGGTLIKCQSNTVQYTPKWKIWAIYSTVCQYMHYLKKSFMCIWPTSNMKCQLSFSQAFSWFTFSRVTDLKQSTLHRNALCFPSLSHPSWYSMWLSFWSVTSFPSHERGFRNTRPYTDNGATPQFSSSQPHPHGHPSLTQPSAAYGEQTPSLFLSPLAKKYSLCFCSSTSHLNQ